MKGFPTFVVHCKGLEERKRALAPQLEAAGLACRWVEGHDPSEIPERVWVERVVNPRLSEGQVSVALKQFEVIQQVAALGLDEALVLEDDAVLVPGFGSRMRKALERLPTGWDVVFLGESRYLPLPDGPTTEDGCFVRADRARTLVAWLLSGRAARALAPAVREIPLERPGDLTLGGLFRDLDLHVYWAMQPLVLHGSETGRFRPSLGVPWRERTLLGRLRATVAKRRRSWRTWLARRRLARR